MLIPIVLRAQVLTGADVLLRSRLDLLAGKRVGIVTNQTGRLRTGEFLVDALVARGIAVKALFGPEHGIRGVAAPGASVQDTIDEATHIRVYSLYGRTEKPGGAMLDSLDLLIYDLQDVGARFYTYISTMYLVMEAGAERHIPVVILDRPDPLGGDLVDGPLMEDSLRSFVGMMPIPVVYGLTCGELARMINGERWLPRGIQADLTVIPMEGWKRTMRWEDTGLPWVAPSPNIPSPQTCLVYPVTCYLEATNVSEGRGTSSPFEVVGAPFVKAEALALTMNRECPAIRWEPTSFTPGSSKHAGSVCFGVRLHVEAPTSYTPAECGLLLLRALARMYPNAMTVMNPGLARLSGSTGFVQSLHDDVAFRHNVTGWEETTRSFLEFSRQYRLYP